MGIFDSLLSLFGMSKPSASDLVDEAVDAVTPDVPGVEADDDDDDDDDGFERDYDLEAKDDSAGFDLANDLKGFYVGEFKVEQAWEDEADRAKLFAEYGIRDEPHWYQVKATVERFIQSPAASAKYGGLDDIMQLKMDATMDHHRGKMEASLQGELKGEIEPVEGVSLQQWAQAQAKVAGGGDVGGIIAGLGIDKAKWDRVSAEWNARMARDTTAAIATEYGKAFSSAGQGQFAGAAAAGAAAMGVGGEVQGEAPIPFEKYVEIEQAQACGVEQGRDAASILKGFGMSALDWSNVSTWWSQHLNRNMMKDDQKLYHEYTALQKKYEAKYKAASADSDISF